jgi:hypothetical protein
MDAFHEYQYTRSNNIKQHSSFQAEVIDGMQEQTVINISQWDLKMQAKASRTSLMIHYEDFNPVLL